MNHLYLSSKVLKLLRGEVPNEVARWLSVNCCLMSSRWPRQALTGHFIRYTQTAWPHHKPSSFRAVGETRWDGAGVLMRPVYLSCNAPHPSLERVRALTRRAASQAAARLVPCLHGGYYSYFFFFLILLQLLIIIDGFCPLVEWICQQVAVPGQNSFTDKSGCCYLAASWTYDAISKMLNTQIAVERKTVRASILQQAHS